MNYFAHAIRFLDRPWFLAGTAVPDWLSAADRRVRLRHKQVEPWCQHAEHPVAELAAGIRQHLDDDGWFHATRGFAEVTAELAGRFRAAVGTGDGFRCGFLGHIVTEMLIDAVLIDDDPDLLQEYHAALAAVDPRTVETLINRMSAVPTDRLAGFIQLFQQERILEDYRDSARLAWRLNQVLRRVKLVPLPASAIRVLEEGRSLIRERLADLLPPERFEREICSSIPLTKDHQP